MKIATHLETMLRLKQQRLLLVALCLFGLLLPSTSFAKSADPYADETQTERDARMEWWREARFGMFIHWGVYSVPAGTYNGKPIDGVGEWIMFFGEIPVAEYREYAKQFNPVRYDPDKWAQLAKEAGMKYIVITSKHHDGFALFDSKVTDWDVVDATPYGKDLLKPLAEACRKHGIKLGFYYSQAQDWFYPGGSAAKGKQWDPAQKGDMDTFHSKIVIPQIREILTNYGDIAVMWWDTSIGMNKERADRLLPLLELQPGIIHNNRLARDDYECDYSTHENYVPDTGLDHDWETCMTMNNTWGFKSDDDDWKSTAELIRNIIDIVSKGGNYLLNVGPTALGEIPAPSIERLKAIGAWMDANGESIYGTTASPFENLPWGRCTKKLHQDSATLYLHVFDWPVDGNQNNKKWVLYGASADYSIGSFDGKEFKPETESLKFDYGNAFYASQTFSDVPQKDGRRIMMGWGQVPMPKMPFNQMITFPVVLTLRTTDKGIRMFAEPVEEVEKLHKKKHSFADETIDGTKNLPGIDGDLFHIKAQFQVVDADSFGIIVREYKITYDAEENRIICKGPKNDIGPEKFSEPQDVPLKPIDGKISLEILVDRTMVEVFADKGRYYFPMGAYLVDSDPAIKVFSENGKTKLKNFEIYELNLIWY